ncbi:MAG: hypothetical protein QW292_12340 [Candidatus Parvarchaeota archaeon]
MSSYKLWIFYFFMEFIGSSGLSSVIDWKWLSENGTLPANNSVVYTPFANTTFGPERLGDWNTNVEYEMVSTGPYEVAHYEPAQEIIIEKNPNYHQKTCPSSLAPSNIIPKDVIEYFSNQGETFQLIESG